jgi:hypothetical protein
MDKLKLTGLSRAEFSTLDVGILVYAMQLQTLTKQPNLKLNNHPFLGSHPEAFILLNLGIIIKSKL